MLPRMICTLNVGLVHTKLEEFENGGFTLGPIKCQGNVKNSPWSFWVCV